MTTPASDLVGRGIAFPLRTNNRGGIALVSGVAEIEAAIRMILGTAPGERVMRPEFGCRIWDLVFAPVEPGTLGLMEQAVREALGQWEPRIEAADVAAAPDPDDPARVLITVAYRVRATNERRNLVYPFYVIPAEEES